ncbi:MAG: rhomboid family intramembrane serine protease [Planctomycetota bacterium]|nr:rhomboid family intramembrane serine protease [Planctomycetota bacterium]
MPRDGFGWQGTRGPGSWRYWSATQWLIVINIAIFVLDLLTQGRIFTEWGCFQVREAVWRLQLWRFITFQFLHANTSHLLFNMIALYFFGPFVEGLLGKTRYVCFYLLCGCAGAAMLIVLSIFGIAYVSQFTILVGASAGILGIIAAAARISPDTIATLWLILPLRLVTLAAIFVGIALVTVLTSGPNAGGEAAHLGGAAVGYFLINPARRLRLRAKPRTRFWRPGDPADHIIREEFRR